MQTNAPVILAPGSNTHRLAKTRPAANGKSGLLSGGRHCGGITMAELKPCPFCGGKAKLLSRGGLHYVVCWEKACRITPRTTWHNTKEKAIEAWNRRAEDGE